jgi:hypothetical protein
MLLKITLSLIVISIALFIISRQYYKTRGLKDKIRFACGINYTKGEERFLMVIGFIYIVTFLMVIITVINLIFRYL